MRCRHAALLLTCGLAACGCRKPSETAPGATEPASVAHHVEEQDLNTITLTESAESRLGIALAEVRQVEIRQRRTFGGEVVVPPGQTITVSAPVAGTLVAPEGQPVPAPGSQLSAGQPVFRFQPLLTPERDVLTPAERVRVARTRADVATARIEAERQIASAKVEVEAAQIAYDRAVQLLRAKAGSQRSVDEAQVKLKLAREAETTAQARYQFLLDVQLDEQAGELAIRTIQSPVSGVLQSLDSAADETVAAGEPLFHVVNMDPVWVRVPVYVGQWREVDTAAGASIAEYGQPPDAPKLPAKYVSAPPSADAAATSVDIYYELPNTDARLIPGQKLSVTVPLRANASSLVVPFSSVLYDVQGGAWVYEQVEPHTYARRRVAVKYVADSVAVLAAGPAPGAEVVTDGAAELFGTEFGVGH